MGQGVDEGGVATYYLRLLDEERESVSATSHSSSGLGHRPFTAVTGVRTPYGTPLSSRDVAGIAQLVEHNLAKVGVASSSLVSRSKSGQ